jgi:tetratricopeptide (TPR) repeat protein
MGGRSTTINILKGSEDIDPQKIGDLGVGILKIPLGSLITVISKMFGGTYVTGALQKYASTNKLILTLEQRTFLSLKKKSVVLFEASWQSENLADGIPDVIEELAYRIIIYLSDDINTNNWKAYKYFLEGNMHFSEYEENDSRKDLLRDAISCWRESLRIDPKFAETHYNLGVASDRDNKISDALFRYDRAVEFGTDQTKTKALANMARLYIQDIKDPDIAVDLLTKAKKINQSQAELWNLEGLIYLNKQKDTEASNCFKEAIELNKKDVSKNKLKEEPVYHYNQSVANYYLKNYSLAESSGLRAYDLYPETAKPIYLLQTLGLIYNMKGEHAKGVKYFEEGLLIEPENRDMLDGYSTALFHLNKYDESFSVNRRLLRVHPQYYNGYLNFVRVLEVKGLSDKIKEGYREIGDLLRNRDINSAIQSVQDKYVSLEMNSIEQKIYATVLAGILFYSRRDYDQSETYFKTAVTDVIPEFESLFLPEALLTYGMALIIKNDPEAAVNCFTKAIPLFTEQQYYDLAICYEKLAEAYINLNKHNEADSAYSNSIFYFKKIKMVTVASEVYAKRASWLTGLYYYSAAENDCDQAIYLNRLNYNAYHYKGNIRYNSRNDIDAISQYEHSVEIFFDVPGTHYTIGLCHFYLGNYEEAVKKFETTLKLKSDYYSPDDMNNPDAYQRLALAWESMNKFENAEEVLKKAVNLFSKKVKYRLLLARVYKKLKKYSDAERELNYCLTLYESELPDFKHLVLTEIADIYLDHGANYEIAFKYIDEAIKILEAKKEPVQSDKDDLAMLIHTKGWACFKLNKYYDARGLLEQTLSSFIGQVKAHSRIAAVYQKLSEIEQDENMKSYYKTWAVEQWRIVSDLTADEDHLKKTADQNIANLTK